MVTSVEEACEVRTDLPPFRLNDPGRCSFEAYSSGSMEEKTKSYITTLQCLEKQSINIAKQNTFEINKSCQMQ